MKWQAVIGWGCGILIAAGCEFAGGAGAPGPLLLTALAAGLFAGAVPGAIVGACAGLCTAVISGSPLLPITAMFALFAALVSSVGTFFSRRNLLVALSLAVTFSFLITLGWLQLTSVPLLRALVLSSQRGLVNSLWMLAIYGIILVFSIPHRPPQRG